MHSSRPNSDDELKLPYTLVILEQHGFFIRKTEVIGKVLITKDNVDEILLDFAGFQGRRLTLNSKATASSRHQHVILPTEIFLLCVKHAKTETLAKIFSYKNDSGSYIQDSVDIKHFSTLASMLVFFELSDFPLNIKPKKFHEMMKKLAEINNEIHNKKIEQHGKLNLQYQALENMVKQIHGSLRARLQTFATHQKTKNVEQLESVMKIYSQFNRMGKIILGDFYVTYGCPIHGGKSYDEAYHQNIYMRDIALQRLKNLLAQTPKSSPTAIKTNHLIQKIESFDAFKKANRLIERKKFSSYEEKSEIKNILAISEMVGDCRAQLLLGKLFATGYFGQYFDEEGNCTHQSTDISCFEIAIKYFHSVLVNTQDETDANPHFIESNREAAQAAKKYLFSLATHNNRDPKFGKQAVAIFCKFADEQDDLNALKKLATLKYDAAQEKLEEFNSKHTSFFGKFTATYWKELPLRHYEFKAARGDAKALVELFRYHHSQNQIKKHFINIVTMLASLPNNDTRNAAFSDHLIQCLQEFPTLIEEIYGYYDYRNNVKQHVLNLLSLLNVHSINDSRTKVISNHLTTLFKQSPELLKDADIKKLGGFLFIKCQAEKVPQSNDDDVLAEGLFTLCKTIVTRGLVRNDTQMVLESLTKKVIPSAPPLEDRWVIDNECDDFLQNHPYLRLGNKVEVSSQPHIDTSSLLLPVQRQESFTEEKSQNNTSNIISNLIVTGEKESEKSVTQAEEIKKPIVENQPIETSDLLRSLPSVPSYDPLTQPASVQLSEVNSTMFSLLLPSVPTEEPTAKPQNTSRGQALTG